MRNIKELTFQEMDAAEKYFDTLANKKAMRYKSTYHKHNSTHKNERILEKTKRLDVKLTRGQREAMLKREKLSIYDVCWLYQKSIKAAYQKVYKDIHNTPYCANYLYTKGWIDFENVRRGKKIETRIHFKPENVRAFLCFYRRVLR